MPGLESYSPQSLYGGRFLWKFVCVQWWKNIQKVTPQEMRPVIVIVHLMQFKHLAHYTLVESGRNSKHMYLLTAHFITDCKEDTGWHALEWEQQEKLNHHLIFSSVSDSEVHGCHPSHVSHSWRVTMKHHLANCSVIYGVIWNMYLNTDTYYKQFAI